MMKEISPQIKQEKATMQTRKATTTAATKYATHVMGNMSAMDQNKKHAPVIGQINSVLVQEDEREQDNAVTSQKHTVEVKEKAEQNCHCHQP